MVNIASVLAKLPGHEYLSNKYIYALVIIVLTIVFAKLVQFIFGKYLQRFAKKTKTKVDDLIFERTKRPIFLLILAYGLKVSLLHLWNNSIISTTVDSLMALVFIFILIRSFSVIVEVWGNSLAKKTKTNVDDVLLPLFHKGGKVVFIIIAILWVLQIWNINITPYLAGAGIAGLVFGMALQDSLKNVFGGVSLILDRNFNINDPVRLEGGQIGTIKDIGLRSTKILSYDNEVLFVPNGRLANMLIRNYKKPNDHVRKIVNFGVEYGTDADKVKKVVLGALNKMKSIHKDPAADVIFVEMGESAINFQARFWVDWDDAYNKWLEATQVIYAALNKAKIGIPFPTRTVHLVK